LPYEDNFFDLVYAISVFPHLSLTSHFDWMRELGRVLKYSGLLILTFFGSSVLRHHVYAPPRKHRWHLIDDQPFLSSIEGAEGSNAYLTVTNADTLDTIFSPFKRLLHIPRHESMGCQDTLIFQNQARGPVQELSNTAVRVPPNITKVVHTLPVGPSPDSRTLSLLVRQVTGSGAFSVHCADTATPKETILLKEHSPASYAYRSARMTLMPGIPHSRELRITVQKPESPKRARPALISLAYLSLY
jgi:hypothetical protein